MWKYVTFFLCLFLISCESSNQNPGPGKESPSPDPVKSSWTWGEAKCQKVSSCENALLNVSMTSWKTALGEVFPMNEEGVLSSEEIFSCGQDFFAMAIKLSESIQNATLQEFTLFARDVLDFENCQIKKDLEKNMNNYLNQYLMENQYETI